MSSPRITSCGCACLAPVAPVVKAAAGYDLSDFISSVSRHSKRPSWPSTARRAKPPRRWQARRARWPDDRPRQPLSPSRSAAGPRLRQRLRKVDPGLAACLLPRPSWASFSSSSSAPSPASTPRPRRARRSSGWSSSLRHRLRHGWQPGEHRDAGWLCLLEVRAGVRDLRGHVVDPRASGTLVGEARRGSLDVLAATSLSKRRSRRRSASGRT